MKVHEETIICNPLRSCWCLLCPALPPPVWRNSVPAAELMAIGAERSFVAAFFQLSPAPPVGSRQLNQHYNLFFPLSSLLRRDLSTCNFSPSSWRAAIPLAKPVRCCRAIYLPPASALIKALRMS